MSERKIIVQREVSEREINVERESSLVITATGLFPTGTKDITENGVHDVTYYKNAFVHVPEPEGTITITENGTVDVKEYAEAEVAVPSVDLSDYFYSTITGPYTSSVVKKIPEEFEVSSDCTSLAECFIRMRNDRISLSGGGEALASLQNMARYATAKVIDLSGLTFSESAYLYGVVQNCTELEVVIFGCNHTSGQTPYIFNGCSSLKAVIIYAETFTIAGTDLFSNSGLRTGDGYVYVPDERPSWYQSAANWSGIASRIKPLSELPAEYQS